MSDLEPVRRSKITGPDEQFDVGVELIDGKHRMLTDTKVTVESLQGFDNIADSWFAIGDFGTNDGAGVIGDTVRVQIAANEFLGAIDLTTTLTALEAGDDTALANKIVADLNADLTFSAQMKAKRIKNNAIVWITSKTTGDSSDRPLVNDFLISTTGVTYITRGFPDFIRRSKGTSLARDPNDPRKGIIGIEGTVFNQASEIGDIYAENATDDGTKTGSFNMVVNGQGTPVEFSLPTSDVNDTIISQIQFSGTASALKYGQFFGSNNELTNGVLLEIKADDVVKTLPVFVKTDDFDTDFASVGGARLVVQQGDDFFKFTWNFANNPFALRKKGTFLSGDDYVKVIIQDNVTQGVKTFKFNARGTEREP